MNHQLIILLFSSALLTGCATRSSSTLPARVNPALIMLPAGQARYYGLSLASPGAEDATPPGIPSTTVAAVINEPEVKAFAINRTVDPIDGELMHEAHVLYRREATPRWRLHASVDKQILIGPRITDGREDLQPILSKELAAVLTEERRANDTNRQAIMSLLQAVEALSRQQQSMQEQLHTGVAGPSDSEGNPVESAKSSPGDATRP